MANVKFVNVNKIYDNNVQAVFDFNLDVKDKEFIVLVGPSGCGKSTTLRMLAGLEEITSGEIIIDVTVVNDVHPKNRDIAMVFQNYALYPHMTVFDNMAFALKMKNLPKEEIVKRVNEAANILALEEYLRRKPKALSGGQRQRVALGRAIVRTPKVFLMDEPLSNLDAKLRVQMRSEIIKIHRKVNATTIYVTHDQTEAMTMADRIVIMKDGYIQQIGTPKEVYNNPSNMFVGGFIGSPAMNFLNCRFKNGELYVTGENDDIKVKLDESHATLLNKYKEEKLNQLKEILLRIDQQLNEYENSENKISEEEVESLKKKHEKAQKANKKKQVVMNPKLALARHIEKLKSYKERYVKEIEDFERGEFDIAIGIRPEDISVKKTNPDNKDALSVDLSELLGHELIIYSYINGQRLVIKTPAKEEFESGESFEFGFNTDKLHLFDIDTTNKIAF